jgi:hypothetical protein
LLPNGLRHGQCAGVDSAREQEKLEARKLLVNRAESHKSAARFVGLRFLEDHNYFSKLNE